MGLVLARQIEFGVGLDFDSAHYVHIARQLLAGEPLLGLDGRVYVEWPPLYPALLAAASGGVFDPLHVAGPLNAALFGATVLLCGTFLRQRLAARPVWAWCGCAAIAIGPPLIDHAATAMATQAFALFVAGALICVAERDPGWRRLVLAAACTALACLTRYGGIALLAVVSAVLLASSDLPWITRVRRTAAYAVMAFAPLSLWLLRNETVAGTLAGYRTHEPTAWLVTLRSMGDQMAAWVFLDLPIENWFGAGWSALLGFVALCACGFAVLRERIGRDVRHESLLFAGFALAHMGLLLVTTQLGAVVRLGPRYLIPLYVPCLLAAWLVLGELLGPRKPADTPPRRRVPTLRRMLLLVSLTLVVVPWLAYQGVMHATTIAKRNLHGYYFDAPRWRESDALRNFANAKTTSGRVYTLWGNVQIVYLFTGIAPHRYNCGDRGFGRDGDYLLWLRGIPDWCWLAGQDDNFAIAGLDLVEDFADGVLLRFNAASASTLADAVWAHLVPTGPPAYSAAWDLYVHAKRRELVFAKASCATEQGADRFFVHVHTHTTDALPPRRRQVGFDNLDFDFRERGLILPAGHGRVGDGPGSGRRTEAPRRCVAVVELPRYSMASLRVGQFAEQPLWAVRIGFDADDGISALRWSSRSDGP